MVVHDTFQRSLRNFRISVTDRCNLRCAYCMPEEDYVWLPREQILHFEEVSALADIFMDLGVDKIRLTGGEPLLRRDLGALIRLLAGKPGLRDLAITTNGVLLAEHARSLKEAGLHRVTVSLDTLRPDRFTALTRRANHAQVLEGIAAVPAAGFAGTKLDTVVMRGVNDDELADLIEYGKTVPAEIRFIEYMDVGGATRWSMDKVVSRTEMLGMLGRRYGQIEAVVESYPGLYRDVLQRNPDQFGFGYWTTQLQTGHFTRLQVSLQFLRSAEHQGLIVEQFYQQILGRLSDAGLWDINTQQKILFLLPRSRNEGHVWEGLQSMHQTPALIGRQRPRLDEGEWNLRA